MFNINQPTVQMMGRYQPWHGGHRELFKQAMKRTGQVAIFVRNMPVNNDNPLKFEEVAEIITEDLTKHNFTIDKDYVIMQVPNIIDITYGRDVGYSATAIRELWKKEKSKMS
ncbi:MAG: cytidyltransferase [Methanobacteriota archaeon]|nr:MAG: cytidyltransferase [Euryarchaeota archaeon]